MRALTARERQVMLLVANGHTNASIAARLAIHRVTVERHLRNTYDKLGARDRANAVAISLRHGEIDLGDIELREQETAA
jgi:DNA-binding CsgD family transcriptional regulator